MMLGLLVAVICALGKTMGPKPIRWVVEGYIEVIRNTPFLIQIFIIFFGLPRAGVFLKFQRGGAVGDGGECRRLRH
jgi:polar amino acid transport system permease protein